MVGKVVSHISKEELEAARNASAFSVPQKFSNTQKNCGRKQYYVDMISDEKIANFFSRYGYLSHVRNFMEEIGSFVEVDCEDMSIMFSDFTAECAPKQNRSADGIFNYDEFEAYCKMIGSEPRIVVADSIFNDLLGDLPYYTEKKEEFDSNNRNKVYRKLSENYKKIFKQAITLQKAKDTAPSTIKRYGGIEPEVIANTMTRYNSYQQ